MGASLPPSRQFYYGDTLGAIAVSLLTEPQNQPAALLLQAGQAFLGGDPTLPGPTGDARALGFSLPH